MNFFEHRPAPPLDRYIDRFWFYTGFTPAHRLERVLPEGTVELVINLQEAPRHTYDSASRRPLAAYRGGWLSGPQSRYLIIDTAPDSSMMGAHFRPGGAAPILGLPADALAHQVVESDSVWGREAVDLRVALLEARLPADKFRILGDYLLRRLRRSSERHPAVEAALAFFARNPAVTRIDAFTRQIAMSRKHFITVFRREVGLTPKTFCRVRRFRDTVGQIRRGQSIRWAELAAQTGYYDQSHLIRDFEAFCGLSPATYLEQHGGHPVFVPLE